MNTPRRPPPSPSADPAGGSRAWRPSWGYLAVALALAVCGLTFVLMSPLSLDETDASAASAAMPASHQDIGAWPVRATTGVTPSTPPAQPTQALPRTPEGDADPTPDLSSYVPRGEKPTMNQVIERLHQAGIHTGLGAFNPPGTRPPLIGLAVPEGFVLPEGYVRHYQATDDGQRIEPILMFAPDRPVFDANHRPIDIPKDRVVPPELAPPGLPIRRIEIPAPIESGRSGL